MDRWQNIPEELRNLDQWVLWRLEQSGDRMTKVPRTPTGALASSIDPGTWCSFATALAAVGRFDGIGFVFSEHDPYTGCDFDAKEGEELTAAHWVAINALSSYSERSQSGRGIHVITKAKLPGPGQNVRKLGMEIYDRGRFFVMTGDTIDGMLSTTIEERQTETAAHYQMLWDAKNAGKPDVTPAPRPPSSPVDLDDQTLLERMFASHNGAKILRLWSGDKSDYIGADGKPDDSGADLALCNHLAFWIGADEGRIDRLFRQSGLYREKWNQARPRW